MESLACNDNMVSIATISIESPIAYRRKKVPSFPVAMHWTLQWHSNAIFSIYCSQKTRRKNSHSKRRPFLAKILCDFHKMSGFSFCGWTTKTIATLAFVPVSSSIFRCTCTYLEFWCSSNVKTISHSNLQPNRNQNHRTHSGIIIYIDKEIRIMKRKKYAVRCS